MLLGSMGESNSKGMNFTKNTLELSLLLFGPLGLTPFSNYESIKP